MEQLPRRGSSPEQSSAAWDWDVMFRGFAERMLSANQLSFANRAFLRSYKDVINLVQSKLDWIPACAGMTCLFYSLCPLW